MSVFETKEFKDALHKAVMEAIDKMGLDEFKKCSWFPSNEMKKNNAGIA